LHNKLNQYLTELDRSSFITNTDADRLRRAREEVRTRPPQIIAQDDGAERMEYNVKADPSEEKKRHHGYIVYDGDDIKEVFCDCKDFSYRLYSPLVRKNLAIWNLNRKYQKRMPIDHNREWTDETNPQGKIFVCKHLAAMMMEYF